MSNEDTVALNNENEGTPPDARVAAAFETAIPQDYKGAAQQHPAQEAHMPTLFEILGNRLETALQWYHEPTTTIEGRVVGQMSNMEARVALGWMISKYAVLDMEYRKLNGAREQIEKAMYEQGIANQDLKAELQRLSAQLQPKSGPNGEPQ